MSAVSPPEEEIEKAEAARAARDWPAVIEIWEKILGEYQAPERAYARLAEAWRHQVNLEQANDAIEEGLRRYPDYLPLYIEKAAAATAARDWLEAIKLWQKVLKKSSGPAPPVAWIRLSQAYRVQGRFADAKKIIKDALKKYPKNTDILIETAYVAMAQKDWPEADKVWQKVLGSKDEFPTDVWRKIICAKYRIGRMDQARQMVLKALSFYPDDIGIKIEAANLESIAENYGEALRAWKKILQDLPVKAEGQRLEARFNISLIERLTNLEGYKKRIEEYAEEKAKKQPRIAIITSVTEGFDLIKPHEVLDSRFDYLMYTDAGFDNLGFYKIHALPKLNIDDARLSRYMKMHPHELSDLYDLVVWLDASIMIVGDLYQILEKFMASGKPIGANVHPQRNTVQEEYEACLALNKELPEVMQKQLEFYSNAGFDGRGLAECAFLAFNLRDYSAEVKLAMETWWEQLLRFSKRDQLSFPYSLWLHNASWYQLTKPPHGIRNHPSLILTSHSTEYPVLDKLYELIKST
jgi:tetratricopeptide (TPR) repeat protein